jgi:hypothetical protein
MPKTSNMHKHEHRDILDRQTQRQIPGPAGTCLLSSRHAGRQTDRQTDRQADSTACRHLSRLLSSRLRQREPTSPGRCILPPAPLYQALHGTSRCIVPPLHCTEPLHWSTRCIVPGTPSYQPHALCRAPAPCRAHVFDRAAAR